MSTEYKRLYRSRTDRMFSGLCAGIGEYVGMDPTVVRVVFALVSIFTFHALVIVYLAMMLIVPEEPAPTPKVEVIES